MKKLNYLLLATALILPFKTVNAIEIKAKVNNNVNNGYVPTEIKNGNFEDYPDKGQISPTGGDDWQTTETAVAGYMGRNNSYFEWINHTFIASGQTEFRYKQNYAVNSSNGNFIEMNSVSESTLYQNLDTNPGDIILWKLSHATRNTSGGPDVQEMEVWVGENNPLKQPEQATPNITKNLARYTANGVNNTDGNYGFLAGGQSDLYALKLNKNNDWQTDPAPWKVAKAVYTIPEGQTSTRFAFTSITPGSTGNLLDDIIFSTLLGNLKIDTSSKDGIKITGYWAPIEENKDIDIEYIIKNTKTNLIVEKGTVDMSALRDSGESGFEIDITYDNIPNGDYTIEVNHSLFADAKIVEEFEVTKSTTPQPTTTTVTKKTTTKENKDNINTTTVNNNSNKNDKVKNPSTNGKDFIPELLTLGMLNIILIGLVLLNKYKKESNN